MRTFFLGGLGAVVVEDSMEYFSQGHWTALKAKLPVPLFGHCHVKINETTIMIIGGKTTNNDILNKTWYFNLIDQTFTNGPGLNYPRYYHGCTYDPDAALVIVFGGSSINNNAETLTLNGHNWNFGD